MFSYSLSFVGFVPSMMKRTILMANFLLILGNIFLLGDFLKVTKLEWRGTRHSVNTMSFVTKQNIPSSSKSISTIESFLAVFASLFLTP